MLLDTERMHAHRVFNIHVMVFSFSAACFGLLFCVDNVTGLWFKMDSSGNVCKHSFVSCNFENRIPFRSPVNN